MSEDFLDKVLGIKKMQPDTVDNILLRRNLSLIHYAVLLVFCVSVYWIVIDFVSPNYNLDRFCKIVVWLQLGVSVLIHGAAKLAKRFYPRITRFVLIFYYILIIAGVAVLSLSRNGRIMASESVSADMGVSVAAFYLFLIAFLPLPKKADSVLILVCMMAGLIAPNVMVYTSTYCLFANVVLAFCFVAAYTVFRRIQIVAAEHEIQIDRLNNELLHNSCCDALTGVLNRRSMMQYIDYLLQHGQKKRAGIIFFDIDYFKKYNDYYGHSSGDTVLKQVAASVEECLKQYDGCFLFRYGGEEFVAVADGADEKKITELMQAIRRSVYEAAIPREDIAEFNRISVTVGGAIEPLPNHTGDYVTRADNQLYRGKNYRRNTIFFHDTLITDENIPEIITEAQDTEAGNYAMVQVMTRICSGISDVFRMDCKTKKVTVYRTAGHGIGVDRIRMDEYDYETLLSTYINTNVPPSERGKLYRALQADRLQEVLRKQENVNFFYRVFRDNRTSFFRLVCIPEKEGERINGIIFAFTPETQNLEEIKATNTLETDELSGIYTRQAFLRHAQTCVRENPQAVYWLVVSDIERFRLVNKVYGDEEGDNLIRYLAKRYAQLQECRVCGRYSGDQFVLLLEADEMFTLADLTRKIEQIRQAAPIPYLTVKYGVYQPINTDEPIAAGCDRAIQAMKTVKNVSGSPIAVYDDAVASKQNRMQLYAARFEQALAACEFVVYCQPQYNTFSKKISGAEALVRWQNADGTMELPREFIPVLENNGMIAKLDEYVFRTVCRRQKEMAEAGMPVLPISVNLSRNSLFQTDVVRLYKGIAEAYGVDKKLVPIEITESSAIDSIQIKNVVKELKDAGFTLHMDDFGSGYSSLASLNMLPIDVVKLDKSLVDDIGNTNGDEILRHIIELAHFLKMNVVAEGVEWNAQYTFLKHLNCDTIQGYLFQKPIPFDDYEQLLRESAPNADAEAVQEAADASGLGALRITNEVKLQYLLAISSIYMTMHVVDLAENTVVEFATTTNIKEYVNRAHNASAQMAAAMRATVAEDYIDAVLSFTDLTTLPARMRGKRTISTEFKGIHFGWCQAQFIAVSTNAQEEPEIVIYTTRVIEAEKTREEDLIRSCYTDEMTGVRNMRALEETVAAFADANNTEYVLNEDTTVLAADINGLKKINERFGNAAGDEQLCGAAVCLNDTVGKTGQVFRLRGDEFIAILQAEPEQRKQIAATLENKVDNWMGAFSRTLSLSYGIVAAGQYPGAEIRNLIILAENVMKEQKKQHDIRR